MKCLSLVQLTISGASLYIYQQIQLSVNDFYKSSHVTEGQNTNYTGLQVYCF